MTIIPYLLFAGGYLFLVFVLLHTGVTGLRGRPIWMPNKLGNSGVVRGRAARVAGFLYLLMGLFLLFMPLRAAWRA